MLKNEKTRERQGSWFKLDNAAKIFPGQNSGRWSNIFRVSLALKQKIDPSLLEKALDDVIERFPCFAVRMRRGFFWYYLEANKHKAPDIMPDIKNLFIGCVGMRIKDFYSESTITKIKFRLISITP
ncbi:MAG: hypothetical protein GX345_08020 [Clostridiales bacterium]|nr:hypothetical protein [Clostridiales bacterium]